jgi:pilus assembly protein Flp/PilA
MKGEVGAVLSAVGGCPAPFRFLFECEEVKMSKLIQAVVNFAQSEDGPTAVEYAVMLALIIVVCITVITALGTNVNNTFSYVTTNVGSVGS